MQHVLHRPTPTRQRHVELCDDLPRRKLIGRVFTGPDGNLETVGAYVSVLGRGLMWFRDEPFTPRR